MNFNKTLVLLICLCLLPVCKSTKPDKSQDSPIPLSKNELSGKIRISGAYALYPLAKMWGEKFMKINPGVSVDVVSNATGEGLQDLKTKQSDLAMISRPLTDTDLATGLWTVPVAKDGVAPIVNKNNPYLKKILERGISPDEFLRIFTSDKPITWGELLDTAAGGKVNVFIRKDDSGAAEVFAEFLNRTSSDFKGTGVTGDEDMIKVIQKNPLAIGFCNFSYAFDESGNQAKDIQIIPSDLDYDNDIDRKEIPFTNLEKAHRGLWLGIYPKNLCRELYLGTIGKPNDPLIIEFLKYVLGEGQNDVKQSRLCELNDVYIATALEKLK